MHANICVSTQCMMPGTATLAEGAVDAGDWGASPPTAAWSFFILSILASSNKLNRTIHAWSCTVSLMMMKGLNLFIQCHLGVRGLHPQKMEPSVQRIFRHIKFFEYLEPIMTKADHTAPEHHAWHTSGHIRTSNRAEKKIAPVCGFLRSVCGFFALGLRIGFCKICRFFA